MRSTLTGQKCNAAGDFVDPDASPDASPDAPQEGDWSPYASRLQFEVAELLYAREQMSASNIDALMELWNSSLLPNSPPFANHVDMYRTIDSTPLGDVRWQCFTMRYADGDVPEPASDAPAWMTTQHEVWYRDVHTVVKHMLGNPDFNGKIDYAPIREFSAQGNRRLRNFMGGDWAWRQAVSIIFYSTSTRRRSHI